MKTVKVELEIPVGEGKPDFKWTYEKKRAETKDDVIAICKEQATEKESAADYHVKAFNYGHDLLLRAAERSKASKASQGPEKEIEKAVKILMANGFPEAAAREMIVNQRKATDRPV